MTASQDELQNRRRIAAGAVSALKTAGLQTRLVTTSDTDRVPGAQVEVNAMGDDSGGVYVDWNASQELSDTFAAPLLAGDFDHPAIRLNGSISKAMADALRSILVANGFEVEEPDDEYRPFSIKVVSSPHG